MRAVHLAFAIFLSATFACQAATDPVRSDAINALGGEAPGVGPGPEHRGGQPCLLCHDGSLGSPGQFSIAGTVYDVPGPNAKPVEGVTVTMKNINDGKTKTATTNRAGNFFLNPSEWSPSYPITVTLQSGGEKPTCMVTHVGRDGSCAGCHVEPMGPSSPGRVALHPEADSGLGVCP